MSEFRVLLEGGDVLVVDIHVEAGVAAAPMDPTSLGKALMRTLGLDREPRVMGGSMRPAPRAKIVRPVEPDADEWLAQTSKESLARMARGE